MEAVVQEKWSTLKEWFWNEDVWLPPGTTWAHIKDTSKVNYAQIEQLYHAFYVALILFLIRIVVEKCVFKPIGRWFGLRPRSQPPIYHNEKDALLEKAFQAASGATGTQKADILSQVSPLVGFSEREVERWWRQRARFDKPTSLDKFSESGWRCTYYASAFAYGCRCLSDKPWLWDTMHCWYNFPHHDMTSDVWWYYMIELGFYISLTFSQFLDVKRKDFWQMFVHHIVTILLMGLSWTCNLTRIGTLVMLLHDFADVPLEAAKMAKYVKKQRVADLLFVVFTLSWIVSRLGLYPYRVIYSTAYQATFVIEMFAAYYIFNSLLLALQVLHIIWTVFIVKIVIQALTSPGVSTIKDLRSEDESSTSDEKED